MEMVGPRGGFKKGLRRGAYHAGAAVESKSDERKLTAKHELQKPRAVS